MILEGKTAIITGATTGIGRASAVLFAREGAQVVVSDWRADRGTPVLEERLLEVQVEAQGARGAVYDRARPALRLGHRRGGIGEADRGATITRPGLVCRIAAGTPSKFT